MCSRIFLRIAYPLNLPLSTTGKPANSHFMTRRPGEHIRNTLGSLYGELLTEFLEGKPALDDDKIGNRCHELTRCLAVVMVFDGGEPGVTAHGDPKLIDTLLSERIPDPFRNHNRDHYGQDVRQRARKLETIQSWPVSVWRLTVPQKQ
jgi:hypothetical protein